MISSRTLCSSLIAGLLTFSMGVHTADALEDHGSKQNVTVPARFFVVISPTATALQTDSQKSKSDDPLPDGKGEDVIKRLCSGCHAVTVFATQRHTPEKWASIVDDMVAKGLDASDDELETIKTYLSNNLAAPKESAPPAAFSEPPSKK